MKNEIKLNNLNNCYDEVEQLKTDIDDYVNRTINDILHNVLDEICAINFTVKSNENEFAIFIDIGGLGYLELDIDMEITTCNNIKKNNVYDNIKFYALVKEIMDSINELLI